MMKNRIGLPLAGVAILALSGCSSSSNDGCHDDCYEPVLVTHYLQTYFDDGVDAFYEGVGFVYYECDSGLGGETSYNGSFTMEEGDYCTFFDLDDWVSYEYDILYIGATISGNIAISGVEYQCDSGLFGHTDPDGAFEFDPEYVSSISDGDVCGFDFFF